MLTPYIRVCASNRSLHMLQVSTLWGRLNMVWAKYKQTLNKSDTLQPSPILTTVPEHNPVLIWMHTVIMRSYSKWLRALRAAYRRSLLLSLTLLTTNSYSLFLGDYLVILNEEGEHIVNILHLYDFCILKISIYRYFCISLIHHSLLHHNCYLQCHVWIFLSFTYLLNLFTLSI